MPVSYFVIFIIETMSNFSIKKKNSITEKEKFECVNLNKKIIEFYLQNDYFIQNVHIPEKFSYVPFWACVS